MPDPSLSQKLAQLTPEQLQRLRQKIGVVNKSANQGQIISLGQQIETSEKVTKKSTLITIHFLPPDQKRPLSFAQQRLWFLDQLEPAKSTYNMVLATRLSGKLDVEVLRQSLNYLLKRHELLHCRLELEDGMPYWIADENIELPFSITTIPEDHVQTQINALAAEPFNLASGLLWRVNLLKISSCDYLLIIIFHHIISDGLSIQLFSQELSQVYTEILNQVAITLPKLPINYSDFSHWQRQWIEESLAQKSLAYWKSHLADSPPLLELPTDYERPAIQSNRGKQIILQLSPALVGDLQTLSQRHGVTLFMTMLATFKLLLARLSGCSDIILGTPVAGRNQLELEPLFGFFVNTVVLRTELDENLTVKTLLQRIQSTVISAYEHQEIPFERLVEEIHPQRSQRYHPIFQVWFNFLVNNELNPLQFPHVITEVLPSEETPAKFDLTLYVRKNDQGMQLRLVYNADLFGDRRAQEMLNQYEALLEQVAAHPEIPLTQISLVTASATEILPNPHDPIPFIPQVSIPDFITSQGEMFAEQVAVVDCHRQWTYQALETQSHTLADQLIAQGLQPQDIVAIYGDRRGDLIWVILGILKAGGAFLLLDPDYPEARLLTCLQMAAPVGVIDLPGLSSTSSAIQEFLTQSPYKWTLRIDEIDVTQQKQCLPNAPLPSINPDHLAYILFTSGSTGQPKGIKVNHHPLVHFLKWYQQAFDVNEHDHFSLLSGLSHDIVLRDIFAPLCLGATLYIPHPSESRDSQQLTRWLQTEGITVTHLTPPLAELISIAGSPFSQLRYCFFGGDKLTPNIFANSRQFAPKATFVNFYGATETPQAIAYDVLPANDDAHRQVPYFPLGKGINHVQLLILTAQGTLAGVGELGEIHVRTPYLAMGYLNDEPATQQAFTPNPFTHSATDRLYKTGDFGRFLPDGRVQFVGRRDSQVKIRGFRIELGEIEAQLNYHPVVQQSMVLVKDIASGEKQLIAYLQLKSGSMPMEVLTWHEYLSSRLPSYMIPSQFVELDSFPLTPNGKIDQTALPQPELEVSFRENRPNVPRSELEEKLAAVWRQVLHQPSIGIHDNFFELGGHSLLAAKLVAAIEKNCGVTLTLSHFFFNPTIAQLSNALKAQNLSVETPSAPQSFLPIKIVSGTPPLFALHTLGIGGKYFQSLSELLPRSVIGVNSQLQSNLSWSFRTIDQFAADYAQDLLTYGQDEAYALIGYSIGGLCAFEVALRLITAGKQVKHLILIDTFFPGAQKISDVDLTYTHQHTQQWLQKRYYQMISELRYLKYVGKPFRAVPPSFQQYVYLRENRKAHRHHQIQVPYPGDVIYIRSTTSRPIHAKTWQQWVKGQFVCHEVSGKHNELLTSNCVMAIADILKTYF